MDWLRNSEDTTFQVIVNQLTVLSCLPKKHICVTICIGDVSKITCSGKLAQNSLKVVWNHPFLFSAFPTTSVQIALWVLPQKLTPKWRKQPLGSPIVTNVASLIESGHFCRYNISEYSIGPATLSITCKIRDVLTVPYGHDCLAALRKYKTVLYNLGKSSKNLASMFTKVEVELARLDLCPLGHADHTHVLNDLGVAYSFCYDQNGNVADLNRSIEVYQRRLDLCPLGHPEHASALGELVMVLDKHYNIQKNREDLQRLIVMKQEWLTVCPLGHTSHIQALGSYVLSLQYLYQQQGDISELNKAIEMGEKLLDLCPMGHPDHATALNNLALSMILRYQKQDDLIDLNRAIVLKEKCLELQPPGHPKHGLALQNLALSLLDRYYGLKNPSDLNKANQLFKKALETYPAHHRYFAFNASQVAATMLLLHNNTHPSNQSPPSLDDAFTCYELLKRCTPAVSMDLLQATQTWVQNAEKYNHSSALEAYQALLNALDHFVTLSSSLDSRDTMIQMRISDTVINAFSCATRHGDLHMAVELLEQGWGILWGQLAHLDTAVAMLESWGNQEHELGRKFTRLSADIREYAEGSVGPEVSPYWRVQEEWQVVVDKVRSLDGFSRFLLPPCFDDLQSAAIYGPVIIVNASKYSCDALIVLHAHTPVHVPLHCSLDDLEQLCAQLRELTQDLRAYGTHREIYVKELLRDLWSSVVEPIASFLQDGIQLPLGSRIWWCPTSKLTRLPFHAAGPHRQGQKNLMDFYISSYAPSLSALLRARDRLHSQRNDAPGTPRMISFAAIGQANPSANTALGHLPEVEHEIQKIRNETNMPHSIEFETITGPAATIEGAVQAFRDHRWVHVTCHGVQHAENPFDSWFAMGDGKLTLTRIIQERYTNSEFAFLSADNTAAGNTSTPDEVVHLAAGMLFAGFNGVIGTLWRVDDTVAHQVITRFYKEMFKYPIVDFQNAAAALNTAVIETAGKVSLEKRITFVHIGI